MTLFNPAKYWNEHYGLCNNKFDIIQLQSHIVNVLFEHYKKQKIL